MDLITKLQSKKIKVEEIAGWGPYLRKQWEAAFASHLSDANKKKIYMDQYLWHAFSYEKVTCATNEKAEELFNAQQKKSCYVFYQHSDDVLLIDRAGKITASDISLEDDIYIVDKDFTWTYVKTHESYCGPYFHKLEKK